MEYLNSMFLSIKQFLDNCTSALLSESLTYVEIKNICSFKDDNAEQRVWNACSLNYLNI